MTEQVLVDNEFFRVTRVTLAPRERHIAGPRGARIVVAEQDQAIWHAGMSGQGERRRADGAVSYFEASPGHLVTNIAESEHTSLIIEHKTGVAA